MPQQYELKQVRVYLKEATPLYSNEEINSPESAIRVMSEALAGMDRECCAVLNCDNRNRVISFSVVSIGDASSAVVPIQNTFKAAILSSCTGVILIHNHPSGILEPSREDGLITEKLIYAGKLLDINVIDHVIVGGTEGKYYSFRQEADFLFEAPLKLGDEIVSDKKTMKDQLKEITDQLEEGISRYMTSSAYKTLISTMSKFHKYSFNNNLLIALQAPGAKYVVGYHAWRKFHRHVKRGARSIKLIAPMTFTKTQEVEKVDPVTQEVILNSQGEPETEKQDYSYQRFRVVNVFDYSQTEGEPLPILEVPELTGDHESYDVFMEAVRRISPVPIRFDDIPGEAKGYYHNGNKEIVIRQGMSQSQTMKTVVHELGHCLCHGRDLLETLGEKKDRVTMELEAESVANCVCAFFNLDTSDYTYPYLAGWAADRDISVLRESMDLIRTTSGSLQNSKAGMKLMTPEQVREMPNRDCILMIEGMRPIYDHKNRPFHTDVWKEAEAAAGKNGYTHPVRVIHDKEKDVYKTVDCEEKILMIDKAEEEFYRNAAKTDKSIHIFDLNEEEFLYLNWDEKKPPTVEELQQIVKDSRKKDPETMEEPEDVKEAELPAPEPVVEEVEALDLSGSLMDFLKRYAGKLPEEKMEIILRGMDDGLSEEQIRKLLSLDGEEERDLYQKIYLLKNNQIESL